MAPLLAERQERPTAGRMCVDPKGKVWMAVSRSRSAGGPRCHLVSYTPGDKAPRDHGVVGVANPDFIKLTDEKGKPKPWHHTLRKEKDGTLTPWQPLGIAASADGSVNIVTLAPFTSDPLLAGAVEVTDRKPTDGCPWASSTQETSNATLARSAFSPSPSACVRCPSPRSSAGSLDKLRGALEQPIVLDFIGQSLHAALEHVADRAGVPVSIDQVALAQLGIISDEETGRVQVKAKDEKVGVVLRRCWPAIA